MRCWQSPGAAERASAELVTHRECLRATDERGLHEGWLAVEFDPFDPTEQLPEERTNLHPREMRAEAEMLTESEREMGGGIRATDIEPEGILEHLLITVSGGKRKERHIARFERFSP